MTGHRPGRPGSTRSSWLLRRVATTVALLLVCGLAGCADEDAGRVPASCSAIASLAGALTEVRGAEGDVSEAARRFESSADLMERTAPPPALGEEWAVAAQALRYYAASAGDLALGGGDDRAPLRSDQELQEWQTAFAEITSHGLAQCGTGWRTPFDRCRSDSPPAGAESIRLLFPCRL